MKSKRNNTNINSDADTCKDSLEFDTNFNRLFFWKATNPPPKASSLSTKPRLSQRTP